MTHTFAVLEISKAAYDEIKGKLEAANYQHAFMSAGGRPVIDMHGIGLVEASAPLPGKPLIYIVALNLQLAEVAAERMGLKHPWEWKSVPNEDSLRGLKEPEVVLVGAWNRRKDADDIQTVLQIVRARISKMELR